MTPAIIIIAYAVVKSQYCIRPTSAAWQQFDTRLEEASQTLGASHLFSTWKVVLPAVTPGVLAGATIAFISCMHDISLTILLSHPQWDPLSLRIYREIEAGRMSRSCAYSVVLLLATMIPYWLISWLQRRRQGHALDMTLLDV
jgi:ABC-type Fe3+ transport system permease subunit